MTTNSSRLVTKSSQTPANRRAWLGRISNKILVSFFGITLLIMITFGAIANYITRNQTLADVGQIQQNTADSQARALGDFLTRQVDMLTTLSSQFTDVVANANKTYTGDNTSIQSEINKLDQEWIAADKANNNADPLVSSRLNNDTAARLRDYRQKFPENVEVFLTDQYGANIAVSNRTSDYNQADEAWWQTTYNNGNGKVYIGELDYDASSKTFSSDIAVPIYGPNSKQVIGVLRSTVTAQSIIELFASSSLRNQVESVDVFFPSGKLLIQGKLQDASHEEQASLMAVSRPYKEFVYEGTPSFVSVSSFASDNPYLKDLGWLVVVHKHSVDALAPVNSQFRIIIIVGFIIVVLATAFSFIFARTLSAPIVRLTNIAGKVASGDLTAEVKVDSNDEIGQLANAFNIMTSQLRGLVSSLEQRVANRTKDLATVAEVSTATAGILEGEKLLQAVVDLTKERFGLYHAHIYLLDAAGENLVLAAGAGEPGRQMKAKGFSIPLNREQSLVARSARERKGVTVNDVTQAPDFLPNPLLPNTRSELAVPMIVGENVIGVFDVQSDEVGRFTDADINIQTSLAAQVGISIQNAHQYEETEKTTAQLTEAMDIARLANWEYDVEADQFTFNDQFYSIFHTTAEREGGYELSSAQYAERLVHPDDVPMVGAAIGEALASTGRHYSTQLEHRILYEDGGIGYISVNVHIERDEQGRITRYYGVNQDITQQKMAEQALRESEERLNNILGTVPTAIAISRRSDGNLMYANPAFGSLLGYDEKELLGKSTPDFYYFPEDRALLFKELGARGSLIGYELRTKHADGHLFYVLLYVHLIRFNNEDCVLFSASDFTQRKHDEETLDKRATELATVADVSSAAATKLDSEEMLQNVVDLTKQRFELYHAHVYLLNETGDLLELASGAGEIGRQMVAEKRIIPTNAEKSLVARTARERKGTIVNDVHLDPDFLPHRLLPETQSEMAVPLIVGETLLGIMDVQSDKVGRFTDEDVNIMTTLSSQIAVALQNSRQFAQVQQQEQLVRTLFQASSAINTASTYNDVLNALRTYTIAGRGAHGVSLSLFDRPWVDDQLPEWITAVAFHNNPEILPSNLIPTHYRVKDFPAIATTLHADRITFFEDVEHSPVMDEAARALYFKIFKAKTILFAPFVVAGQWIGYVNILFTEVTPIPEQDMRLLSSLTDQVAVAVQNLHSAEQIGTTLRDLRQSEGRLTEALTNAKMAYWEYDVPTGIYTFNDQFYAIYHTTAEEQGGYSMNAQDYSQRFTMPEEDGPVVFSAIQKALETTDPNYSQTIEHRFIRSDGTQGYLTVRFHILQDENHHTIKFIGANQDTTEQKLAELSIEKRARQLATVSEVATAVATILTPDALLQTVVDLTKERFELYHAHIYLLDATGENLVLAAGAGEPGRQMKAKGFSIPLNRDQSLVARSARERKGVIVNDVTLTPDFLPNPLLPDTRSELAVPMVSGGTVIGVFDVQSNEINQFNDEDILIQTTLASQAAIALQNARTFSMAQRQAERETTLNTISQKIQGATTVEAALQIAARELGRALGAPLTIAQLGLKEQGNNGGKN